MSVFVSSLSRFVTVSLLVCYIGAGVGARGLHPSILALEEGGITAGVGVLAGVGPEGATGTGILVFSS